MFTGIIECVGTVLGIKNEGSNTVFEIQSPISSELKVDQSVSHNGVCLTITKLKNNIHNVVAIKETLIKTNLGTLAIGNQVNLERCLRMNGRLDGHIVQGHVDQTAWCTRRKEEKGSWYFTFQYDMQAGNITIEKGSVCVNGVSLTVVDSQNDCFSVAIIPYTYQHTTFRHIQEKSIVNVEFDMLGKYIQKIVLLSKQ